MTLRTVHLHGALKKQFGPKHRFDVGTAAEALRALNCAFPGAFVTALQTGSYKLVRGALRTGLNLADGDDLDLIMGMRLGSADLHLIPAAKGAVSGKGVAKTVLGVALIGGAIFMSGGTAGAGLLSGMSGTAFGIGGFTWGNVAMIGLGLTLAGASTLLANPAATPIDNEKDQSRSFSGVSGNGNQGDAIPCIYGECLVPGIPISFDMNIEDTFTYNGSGATGIYTGPFGSITSIVVQGLGLSGGGTA